MQFTTTPQAHGVTDAARRVRHAAGRLRVRARLRTWARLLQRARLQRQARLRQRARSRQAATTGRPAAWLGSLALALTVGAVLPAGAEGQASVRLSGYVRSAASEEVLRSARLEVVELGISLATNRFGFYSIELPPGAYSVEVSSLGYETALRSVNLSETASLDFALELRPIVLADITVEAEQEPPDIDPSTVEMSVIRFDAPAISRLPVVLGEADPIRTLTLYPGISTTNDATTAINVRGGRSDENLILLDDSEVFNPAHAIGLFSTFNTDAVDDVTLYKGAIPARHGGRLSSVLEVQQREGNSREFEGAATVGLLASRLSLEGPLPGGSGSWLVAGRRTYADLFTRLSSDPGLRESVAYFYDLNAKANVRYGATGQVMVSGYFGRDRLKIGDVASVGWGNAAGTLRWNQGFGSIFSHVTLAWSDYDYRIQSSFNALAASLDSRVGHLSLSVDESWHLGPRDYLHFGAGIGSYDVRPANVSAASGSAVTSEDFDRRRGLSPDFYVEHETELGRLALRYGLRASGFIRRGEATVYDYANDAPVIYRPELGRHDRGTVTGSTRYGPGETITSHWGLEPRLGVRLRVGAASSVKASYSRTRQYMRLVTNTNSPTPLDLWDLVGPWVEPHVADQGALGYVTTFSRTEYALSGEIFLKRMDHLIDYVDGADLFVARNLEVVSLEGQGRGYGFEMLLRKTRGRLRGWASYTLSRSQQRTPGISEEDPGLNGGDWYPSPYDRTHDVAVTSLFELGRGWTAGGNFIFATGLPTTWPVARYQYGGLLLGEFGPRNAERLPDYHRLDLSFSKRFGSGELQFGIFNAYNRFNAQALAFRQREGSRLVTEAVETSVFGIVPSISYRRHF